MKAFQVTELGQPPVLTDIERPIPASSEVALKIHACGLNFADLLMVTGAYQERPPLPFTLGLEVAGVVTAIGSDVTHLSIGDRVAVFGGQGGLAEYGCFAADQCLPIPDAMPYDHAAGFQVAYGTSHLALDHKAHLRAGETLVVTGAAGGVGLTAVEIGKKMGATVIAIARGADKLAVAQNAGADHLIDAEAPDIRDQIKALGGADVVYDAVGGDLFTACFRACNPEARVIVIGFASGTVPQIAANHLLVKNISVQGHYWGGYLKFAPQILLGSIATLMDWYAKGDLHPHISHSLPLSEAQTALDVLQQRKSTGKVVVTMP
jgi:NADPH2:quinone reductase